MVTKVVVKRGIYRDSISLLQLSKTLAKLPGVSQAAVVMATELNRRVLAEAGFGGAEVDRAAANDMIVAIDAKDERSLATTLAESERLLLAPGRASSGQTRPTSLEEAMKLVPDANLAVISVPGQFARGEAMKALARGLNVLLFSSNVSLQEEVELKKSARAKGLLMMGPDCGTSIINHKVLGFGNAVRRGSIGIVSASGTGIQEVSTLIHRAGLGISQAIGTGSADLSEQVGGTMMITGIEMLEADRKTKTIVLISKPPAPVVAEKILATVRRCRKPVVVNFIGAEMRPDALGKATGATTLEDAARVACALSGARWAARSEPLPGDLVAAARREYSKLAEGQRYVRGIFAGGTLSYEAQIILGSFFGRVHSNEPIKPEDEVRGDAASVEHTCIDMGAGEFVSGRLHPMIDFTLRNRRILKEAADAGTAVLLLDVELGYGANPDPAAELVPVIRQAKALAREDGRYLSVTASVVATREDSQGLERQERALEEAGVLVAPSNASATRLAALIASRRAARATIGRRL